MAPDQLRVGKGSETLHEAVAIARRMADIAAKRHVERLRPRRHLHALGHGDRLHAAAAPVVGSHAVEKGFEIRPEFAPLLGIGDQRAGIGVIWVDPPAGLRARQGAPPQGWGGGSAEGARQTRIGWPMPSDGISSRSKAGAEKHRHANLPSHTGKSQSLCSEGLTPGFLAEI